MWEVANVLAMDRTTLTAALKPLERRGLVKVLVDKEDKRSRRLALTPAGRKLLFAAVPIWKREHALIERHVAQFDASLDRMRADLRILG
jgi:DNA-binding MarR family transcriptional regulator